MILHLRTHLAGNRYEVTASLGDDDREPFVGQQLLLWDDMGIVEVISVDRAPSQAGVFMTPAEIEHFRVLVVATRETVGWLPNLGGRVG